MAGMFNASETVALLAKRLEDAARELGRSTLIVGASGGVDSSVSLALAVIAFGAENVRAVAMPERENSPESIRHATLVSSHLGTTLDVVDLTSTLEALGCYDRRDAAVRSVFPTFDPNTDSVKVAAVQDMTGSRMPAIYSIEITNDLGETMSARLNAIAYSELFSASNLKQRVRALTLYDFADRYNGAVVGTSNLDESYLGFFVKLGDGSYDISPLDRLTKSSVYALAVEIGLPDEIITRQTTTDTFPNEGQSQTSMFYGLPFEQLDVLLDVLTGKRDAESAIDFLGWSRQEFDTALHNLQRRHHSTRWNRSEVVRLLP